MQLDLSKVLQDREEREKTALFRREQGCQILADLVQQQTSHAQERIADPEVCHEQILLTKCIEHMCMTLLQKVHELEEELESRNTAREQRIVCLEDELVRQQALHHEQIQKLQDEHQQTQHELRCTQESLQDTQDRNEDLYDELQAMEDKHREFALHMIAEQNAIIATAQGEVDELREQLLLQSSPSGSKMAAAVPPSPLQRMRSKLGWSAVATANSNDSSYPTEMLPEITLSSDDSTSSSTDGMIREDSECIIQQLRERIRQLEHEAEAFSVINLQESIEKLERLKLEVNMKSQTA